MVVLVAPVVVVQRAHHRKLHLLGQRRQHRYLFNLHSKLLSLQCSNKLLRLLFNRCRRVHLNLHNKLLKITL